MNGPISGESGGGGGLRDDAGGPGRREAQAPDRAPAILVVDDEPHLLKLLVRMFERSGFRVFQARDGQKAFSLFRQHQPEIEAVFLDVVIPPAGVADLLERIHVLRDDLGVVLTSGDSVEPELRRRLQEWGGLFLRKPFAPDAAVRAVREVLGETVT